MEQHIEVNDVIPEEILQFALFTLDRSPEGIFWVSQTGRFLYVNEATCHMLGYSRDELLRMSVFDIDPNRAPEEWSKHWQEAKDCGSLKFETLHQRKDGTILHVELVVNYLNYGGREYLSTFSRDITERIQAVEELRASEKLLSQFVENVPVDVEMFDTEMRYLLTSRRFRTDYGFDHEKLAGRSHYEVFPESIKWTDVHQRGLAGEVIICDEDTIVWPDGHIDWLRWEVHPWRDKDGRIGGIMIFSELITDRKLAEQAIRESQEKYRTLVERISDWVWEVDEDCVYIYASPKVKDLLGYEPDEILGKTCFDFMLPEEAERVSTVFIPIAKRQQPFKMLENTLICKNGQSVIVETSGEPVFDSQGNFRGYRGIDRDVTERKLAERALKESEERLNLVILGSEQGFWDWNVQTGELYLSKHWAEMIGADQDELRMHISDWENKLHPDDKPVVTRAIEDYFKGRTPIYESEHRVMDRSGEWRWLLDRGKVVARDEEGKPLRMAGTYTDISRIKRAEELDKALNRINAAISSTLDFNEIMRRTVVEAAQAVGAESAAISMHQQDYWEIRYVHNLPDEVIGIIYKDEDAPHLAALPVSGEPIAINDLSSELVIPEIARLYDMKSVLLVPLVIRKDIIGLISFHVHSHKMEFDCLQMDFAAKLATSVSLALENARLYEAERAAAEREANARTVIQRQFSLLQQALIPLKPALSPGYVAADVYVPLIETQNIGGDFYEIFRTEKGNMAVLIGDVSGKDIEAATLAAAARSTVRAFAYEMNSAKEALIHANAVISGQQLESGLFVTVFLAILDPDTGRIWYSTAGHPPPAIQKADGSVEFLEFGQPPIGALENTNYEESEISINPGDRLVCYTDGISEARRDGNMFEIEGIERALKACSHDPINELVDDLVSAAKEWANGHLTDDIAVLVVEREK